MDVKRMAEGSCVKKDAEESRAVVIGIVYSGVAGGFVDAGHEFHDALADPIEYFFGCNEFEQEEEDDAAVAAVNGRVAGKQSQPSQRQQQLLRQLTLRLRVPLPILLFGLRPILVVQPCAHGLSSWQHRSQHWPQQRQRPPPHQHLREH